MPVLVLLAIFGMWRKGTSFSSTMKGFSNLNALDYTWEWALDASNSEVQGTTQ